MNKIPGFPLISALMVLAAVSVASGGSLAVETFPLWPAGAPNEKGDAGQEHDTTKAGDGLVSGQRVIRLGEVSKPEISVYRPPKEKANGAAVVVCPGGGYHILAMDLEGTEVCEWFNSIGVTRPTMRRQT